MAKKKNWDIVKRFQPKDTLKNRDVYENQQLERGEIGEKSTMGTRNLLNLAISGTVCLLVWMFISLLEMAFSGGGKIEQSENPDANYVYVAEHYENVNDGSDKISIEEYRLLLDTYQNAATLTPVEAPVEPEKPDLDAYMFERGGYAIPGQPDTWVSAEEYENLENTYKQALEDYKAQLAEYNAYQKATTNPEETYHRVVAHYRNRNNLEEAIHEEDFEALKNEYNTKLSKNKISADSMDVPLLPFNPADYWVEDSYGEATTEITNEDGSVTSSTEQRAITYRNKLDGRVISYIDYDELINKYNQDVETFKVKYNEHRKLYHPDDVDGTKKTFNIGPTKIKFLVSFAFGAILFSVLYVFLKRNLDAENISKDHTDINQYQGDQHIALPEEVQKIMIGSQMSALIHLFRCRV